MTKHPGPDSLPVHSPVDNRLLGWIREDEVPALLTANRGRLIRDRKGRLRRVYLTISAADEYDPRVWDLLNRMGESRKTVYRQVVGPSRHQWVWAHRLSGDELEAAAAISVEELRADGVLSPAR